MKVSPYILPGIVDKIDVNRIRAERLVDVVAECFGITRKQIQSKSRKRIYAEPRIIAMYLLKVEMGMKPAGIGKVIHKERSTVTRDINTVSNILEVDKAFKSRVDKARSLYNSRP